MSYEKSSHQLPAPCIIDFGTIINKDDIRRLLNDLGRVRYVHTVDGKLLSQGEGWIVEVFADPNQATIVANHKLYINVLSFDYLKIEQSTDNESYFNLIQDSRQLRLIPLTNSLLDFDASQKLDADALEAMVTQVLSARWDVQLDDDDDCPF
ncbi:hypothetical protein [Gloeothece verrucosa]|uniref:Uncharacterized protein n=1 Tax=Gloeothece verrucosa (strain PCC 7822) TaxID=497965 RepID=E0UBH5_GLOV7|nr:hypothetical protein [Gloeothece verrucosa]ADN12807.1 conserved hypothetical protein [Gloeothece verrucosa PCC 7822]